MGLGSWGFMGLGVGGFRGLGFRGFGFRVFVHEELLDYGSWDFVTACNWA